MLDDENQCVRYAYLVVPYVFTSRHPSGEFPFPRMMESPRAVSPGSSLQSRSDSSQSKSLRSASSSGSPHSRIERDRTGRRHRHHHDHPHHRPPTLDEADADAASVQAKLLAHLYPTRESRDARSTRTALALTTERLEGETRRADAAEQRVIEVLRKLRAAHEATMLAQADASRAREELTLYRYRLEDALREITRANDVIATLEGEKLEAEAEAARARSTARRYREQQVIARAREEGRMLGFQEGLMRGKDAGYQEALDDEPREPAGRRYKPPTVEDDLEDDISATPQYAIRGTPNSSEPIRIRPPDTRSRTPGQSILVSGRATPDMREPFRYVLCPTPMICVANGPHILPLARERTSPCIYRTLLIMLRYSPYQH